MFKSPGDVFISIAGFPVYYYGIIMALACFLGVYTSIFLYRKLYSLKSADKIWDFSAVLLLFGIIGARLYYCILNADYYFKYPLEIINIREGGLSIHGALLAGVLTLILFAQKYKIPIFKLTDVFACGTALGQSIGRWGNFFNSEAFGYPTSLPWKLYIEPSARPDKYYSYDYFHPTFLYESIFDIILFFVLIFLIKKFHNKFDGLVTFIYLILYSVIRFFVEYFRVDSAFNVGDVPIAQIISLVIIIVSFIGIVVICSRRKINN